MKAQEIINIQEKEQKLDMSKNQKNTQLTPS